MSLTLPIDTAVILDPSLPVSEVAELLCTSISDQLVAIETCLCQFAEVSKDITQQLSLHAFYC